MGIGTSDGHVYEDELAYHMGEPTLRITVNKAEPIEDPNLRHYPYDDSATVDQRIEDINSGKPDYYMLKEHEQQMEQNQTVPQDESNPQVRPLQNIADVKDPFNTRVEGKDQSRVPPNAPFPNPPPPVYETSGKGDRKASLQIDRTDGINFLMNDPVKVAEGGEQRSIANIGQETFYRNLFGLEAGANPTESYEVAPRDSLERQAGNTYRREIRRSPADGTFRSADQMHTDWEGFNTVRVRPQPHTDPRDIVPMGWATAGDDTPETRTLNSGRQTGMVEFETKTGKQGVLTYIYNPNKKDIYIQWMGGLGKYGQPAWSGKNAIEPHELGIDRTMKILKAVVEQYPEAETITAYRAGGARVGKASRSGMSDKVTRPIPRDRLDATPPLAPLTTPKVPGLPSPGFGAMPGTRLNDLY